MTLHMRHAPRARLTTCSYGLSRLQFRGPRRPTEGRYLACLGGSETFARDVAEPYPELLERRLGTTCPNLGQQLAGPDLFLRDDTVRALIHDAAGLVVQVTGATNLGNRYYKVHPRRNDRFIAPSAALRALYPEVDFTEIAFTGHLMARLIETDPQRFAQVRAVLQDRWVRRMRDLLGLARGPVHLLWFAPRRPEDTAEHGPGPSLVTAPMLRAVAKAGATLTQVVYEGRPGAVPAAPGAEDHRRAAAAISDAMGL